MVRAMEAIIDVVLPVFAIIAAGWLCGRLGLLGDDASQALNGFVYFAALPALFFGSMATVPLAETLNLPFILDFMGTVVVLGLLTWAIGRRFFPGKGEVLGLQNMSALFANTGYMGIPLLLTAFGSVGKLPAIIATVLNGAIVMAFYIALVEYHQSDAEHRGKVFADAALGVVKSPLVISAALGILWSGIGLPVPVFLAKFCEILGAAAPPSALFAMGLFLVGKSFRGDMKEIGMLTALKLAVHPLLAWGMLILVPLDAVWAQALLVLTALPTGSLVFVLSSRYGVYTQRSTGVILASTLASVASLSLLFNLLGVR
ncbi:MAG TPA: AEC family transporter [Dongiaceae bacterium]|jgi:predicted permease|nr:AEC family transporter [Dongiaceae bacterium]